MKCASVIISYSFSASFSSTSRPFELCLSFLSSGYYSKTKTTGLERFFSEHNTQRFLHSLLGQTAHLQHVSLTGLVYLFPLSPLTLQTDDLMQIDIASLSSWVV